MQRELLKRQISRLQTVEARLAAGMGPGFGQGLLAIHAGKHGAVLLGITLFVQEELDAGAQGAVVVGPLGREHRLVEFHGPVDEIDRRLQLACGQRQHGLELTNPQGMQSGALGGGDAEQLAHPGAFVVPLFIQLVKQRHVLLCIPLQRRQRKNSFPQVSPHGVVGQQQILGRIDVGHAGHQDAAGIDAQVLVVGDVDRLLQLVEDADQVIELFLRRAAKIPVGKLEVRILLEQIPADEAGRVDEVGLQVVVIRYLLVVKRRRYEHVQILETTPLQQLGDGALEGHFEARVGTEGGKAGTIAGVEQHHADDRITAAQWGIEAVDGEAFGLKGGDGGLDPWVTGDHLSRDLRQADGLGDDLVLHVTLEHLGERLGAGLCLGVAGTHAVGDIEVADDVHRDVDGLMVGLALERQGDDTALLVARLQIH